MGSVESPGLCVLTVHTIMRVPRTEWVVVISSGCMEEPMAVSQLPLMITKQESENFSASPTCALIEMFKYRVTTQIHLAKEVSQSRACYPEKPC